MPSRPPPATSQLWTTLVSFYLVGYQFLEIPPICFIYHGFRSAVKSSGLAGQGKEKPKAVFSFLATCLTCTFCLIPHDHSSLLCHFFSLQSFSRGGKQEDPPNCFDFFFLFLNSVRASKQANRRSLFPEAGALRINLFRRQNERKRPEHRGKHFTFALHLHRRPE